MQTAAFSFWKTHFVFVLRSRWPQTHWSCCIGNLEKTTGWLLWRSRV